MAAATPGRLLDLAKLKACTLGRLAFLVLDEADRMLDMGFEPQVRQVVAQVRPAPDRQAALFPAPSPPEVERLAQALLTAPVRIAVGAAGAGRAPEPPRGGGSGAGRRREARPAPGAAAGADR